MHMSRKSLVRLAAIGLTVLGCSKAFGVYTAPSAWTEDSYYNGFGGAVPGSPVEYSVGFSTIADYDGRVLSNAAITDNLANGTPLTTINTSLFSGTDANLYKIKITDPASFSASLPSTSLVLALFDSSGKGLAASIGGAADAITGANAGVTSPGTYYIGLADQGGNPQNAALQNIFGLTGVAGVFTPVTADAVLGTDPATAWTISFTSLPNSLLLSNTSFTAGGSTITLTGAGFAVPEPTSLATLGLAAAGLLSRRRKIA
jgi:hypothetical protein